MEESNTGENREQEAALNAAEGSSSSAPDHQMAGEASIRGKHGEIMGNMKHVYFVSTMMRHDFLSAIRKYPFPYNIQCHKTKSNVIYILA